MADALYLAWRFLVYNRIRSFLLLTSLTLVICLPVIVNSVVRISEKELTKRADTVPLIVGARGSSLDLAMSSLYFHKNEIQTISIREFDRINNLQMSMAVPIYNRFQASGHPIVGTSLEYFELHQLEFEMGDPMMILGDCVLGSEVARNLGLSVGDSVVSDPESVFDIAGVYPLRMNVTGILAPSYSPDDHAIFTDIKTTWVIQGIGHGHEDLSKSEDQSVILDKKEGTIRANAKLKDYQEITPENIASFHFHMEPDELPLSSILVRPDSQKGEALIKGEFISRNDSCQVIAPDEVINELIGSIFQIKKFLDIILFMVMFSTLLLITLIMLLTMKLRAEEMKTMFRLGCSRGTVFRLLLAEVVLIFGAALLLSGVIAGVTLYTSADTFYSFLMSQI